jgi:hypothetical protein
LKTEIFQKIDSLIKVALPHFDAYVVFLKETFSTSLRYYGTGWLNFEDYLYPHGRSHISKNEAIQLLTESNEKDKL